MSSSKIISFSLFWILSLKCAHASSFKPNCTVPPIGTNYVSGPNTRGTFSILWNCVSIIFLCTWSIQHLNIPAMRPRTNSTLKKIWWAIVDSRTKIKWMIFTILIPEYILGKALNERLSVKGSRIQFRDLGLDWEEVHLYMANMGYFVLDVGEYLLEASNGAGNRSDERQTSMNDPSKFQSGQNEAVSSLQEMVKEMLALEESASGRLNLSRLTHRYWALVPDQITILTQTSSSVSVFDLPTVPARQLEALNRSDILVKALALVQISYLIVQLVARKLDSLPSAQLEIGALAFSVLSLITYVLYWNRPQGVEGIHILKPNRAPSEDELREISRWGPTYLWTRYRSGYNFEKELDLEPLPNDGMLLIDSVSPQYRIKHITGSNDEIVLLSIGALLGGTLFSGLHCLAWNFHFPTKGEAMAWRVCSVMTSFLPILAVVPMGVWIILNPWGKKRNGSPALRLILGLVLIFGFLVPYTVARLFLIVEMFRSLFFLPPEAYIDTWSGSLPHWG